MLNSTTVGAKLETSLRDKKELLYELGRTGLALKRTMPAPFSLLVRQPVDDVVHAELVGFVRFVDRPQPRARPLPELRHIGVVVHDHLQALAAIVVLEQTIEDRPTRDVGLRDDVEPIDFEERVED